MKITRKDLIGSQLELKVSLDSEDIKPYLQESAKHISHHLKIAGFRPGKAPYELVKREVGEEKIFQEAVDSAINSSLIKALQQEDVYPYGDPELTVDKLTPLKEIDYTVKMAVYPKVTLGTWPTEKVKKNKIEVPKDEVEKSIKDLAAMLVREEAVERAAEKGDGAIIDFDVLVNGVPIEGGSAKDFNIVIGEGKMIPGFEDQLIGMKAGENKDFKLNFPTDYKQDLAGKEAEFKIGVKQVLKRTIPEIDDEMAKRLGVADRAELYKRMEDNLKQEREDKENQRAEIEAVKKVVDAATVGELPEKMVHDEIHKLLHEFEHDLAQQGLNLQSYLGGIGKKKEDLEKEFEPKAENRIKTSLVLDELAEQEKIDVDDQEVETEWNKQKQYYNNQPEVLAQVQRDDYRRHLKNRMIKIKTVDLINNKLVE